MSYKKALNILPGNLLKQVQEYVDGESIYIPRKSEKKKGWGASTSAREEIQQRNVLICRDYMAGNSERKLSQKYFLSLKSIQRIVRNSRQR